MAEAPASVAPPAHEAPAQRRRRWALFGGIATVVVVLDQLTKIWVDSGFELASRAIPAGQPGGPTELIGEYVRIAKTYNDGAIFGFLDASATIMAALSVLVIVAIVWYEWRHGAGLGPLVTIGLGLLTGGAIGNLIDRVRFGHVVDFVVVDRPLLAAHAPDVGDEVIVVTGIVGLADLGAVVGIAAAVEGTFVFLS